MLRHAIRTLSKNRGATIVVVLTIAVAIAATTVIYSAIDLVWGFIPVVKRDGLLYVASTDIRVIQAQGTTESVVVRRRVAVPDLAARSGRWTTFDHLAVFELGSVNLTGIDVPIRASSVLVTANLVTLWGFTPVIGRPFQPQDGRAGAIPVALLTFGFWQREFSSDPTVLGRSVL